jgi:hypothetical protein
MFQLVLSAPNEPDFVLFPATLGEIERIVGNMQDDETVTITVRTVN